MRSPHVCRTAHTHRMPMDISLRTSQADHPHPQLRLRMPTVEDAAGICALAGSLPQLDRYAAYLYLLLCDHFADTCVVGETPEQLLGFITGYRVPARSDTLFVWQVGIDRQLQGRGVASALLDALFARPESATIRYLEATVSPDNHASRRLFTRFAERMQAPLMELTGYCAALFPVPHPAEPLLRIGPIPTTSRRSP